MKKKAVQKWEYNVISGSDYKVDLGAYGLDGWELTAIHDWGNNTQIIFKRPL